MFVVLTLAEMDRSWVHRVRTDPVQTHGNVSLTFYDILDKKQREMGVGELHCWWGELSFS